MEFYKEKILRNHTCTSAVITRNGRVLLGLRKYDKHPPVWIAPGGRCDNGEKPEVTIRREAEEEIGVTDLKIVRKLGEKDGAYEDATGKDRVHMFLCTTEQEPRLMEPEKFAEWRWFALNELPENLLDQKDREFFAAALAS